MRPISSFFLAAMLLSACSFLPDRPVSPALHDFGSVENFKRLQCGSEEAWSAVSVEAPLWLQDENIRYRLRYADPTRIRFYAQDQWLAAPSSMLAQRLSLANCGQGFRLKIRLLEFEQVFDEAQSARVIMVFRASAQRPSSEPIVGEKLFSFSVASPSADAKGAVNASARLLDEVLNALQNWLAELPAQP